jgi:hypothetical protein
MRRTLLGIAVLALALSACELRAEISVNQDGSGTFGMVFAVGPEMREMLKQPGLGGGDPFAELRSDLADDPVAWTVEDYKEGALEGVRATFEFSSPQDLREKVIAMSEDPQSESALSEFSLERSGEGWSFRGIASDAESELGGGGDSPFQIDQLASLVKVQFRVTLPGRSVENNADEVETGGGKTAFIWKPSLTDRGISMIASTKPGGGSSLPLLPIAAVIGVLGVGGALFARRRKASPLPLLFGPDGVLPERDVAEAVGAAPPVDVNAGAAPKE